MESSQEDYERYLSPDYWRYTRGHNTIPAITTDKKPIVTWTEWQDKPIPEELYNTWKNQGLFNSGFGLVLGKLHFGNNSGKYCIVLDFDNEAAVCKWFKNWDRVINLSEKTRIEYHEDKGKIHVFLLADKSIEKRSISIGLEVRCERQLIWTCMHKSGKQWLPINTEEVYHLDDNDLLRLKSQIDAISADYMSDMDKDAYIKYLLDPNTILKEGERHNGLLTVGINAYYRSTDKETYEFIRVYNEKHCDPPKDEKEIKNIFDWIVKHHKQKKDDHKKRLDEYVTPIEGVVNELNNTFSFASIWEFDEIRTYDDGVYRDGGDVLIEKLAQRKYGLDLTNKHVSEIKGQIKRSTWHTIDEFDTNIKLINLNNGLYNLDKWELEEHSPDYLSLRQKPIIYDVNAPIPRKFIKFIKQVVYPQDVWPLLQLMAYTFYRDNPFEIITILHGSGDNGKSVLLGILKALHGEKDVSNVPLKTMAESPYGLHDLVGKDVNLDPEVSKGTIEETARIKRITGREHTRVEQKWKIAYDVKLHTKLWLSANRVPTTSDDSDAWFKRMTIVSFPNKFGRTKCDICGQIYDSANRNLIYELTTPEELSGIFNLLMYALRRILNENKISVSDMTIEERREKYEMATSPIGAFIKEAIEEESIETNSITKEALYVAYEYFIKKNRLAKESYQNFCKILKDTYDFIEDRERTGDKRRRLWKGVALTADYIKVIQGEQKRLDNEEE